MSRTTNRPRLWYKMILTFPNAFEIRGRVLKPSFLKPHLNQDVRAGQTLVAPHCVQFHSPMSPSFCIAPFTACGMCVSSLNTSSTLTLTENCSVRLWNTSANWPTETCTPQQRDSASQEQHLFSKRERQKLAFEVLNEDLFDTFLWSAPFLWVC